MKNIILVLVILMNSFLPTYAECEYGLNKKSSFCRASKQTAGVISGIAVSPIVGGARGLSRGFIDGTLFVAEGLMDRDGGLGRSLGAISGGLFGGAFGLASGLLRGAYNGITYGISEPFSKKHLSADGEFLDYEVY